MSAVHSGFSAGMAQGMDAWKNGPPDPSIEIIRNRYAELELLATGRLFTDYAKSTAWKKDPRVYKGISLLWNHTSRIPQFYSMLVYQGRLSTNPGEGAIPIVLAADLSKEEGQHIMNAIGVLYRRWNWQRAMKLRPRKSATLGDWPTELVDDLDRRFVYPRPVWPGYITDIETDPVGNVEAYTIEYMATERKRDGTDGETFRFKKVVTEESYSYFRDDKPFAYNGAPSSYKNPYGFAPMIWDRHLDNGLDDRGESAFGATVQQLFYLNSLASHARDAQHKNFMAPVIVAGRMTARKESRIDLSAPKLVSGVGGDEVSAMAEQSHFIEAEPGVGLHQPNIAVDNTLEWIRWMQEGILSAHPEITFFDNLAEKSQVSAPGADRVLLPVRSLIEDARDGLDPNTVHLFQMALSMCGYRLHNGSWGSDLRNGRDAFKPFDLNSYDAGKLAFSIADRDVLPPSETEVVDQIRQKESLRTKWGMARAGIEEDDIKSILEDRMEGQWRGANAGSAADLFQGLIDE